MPRPVPDHALRRLVADLAAVNDKDVGAILSELSETQRDKVGALLAELEAGPRVAPRTTAVAPVIDGFSPWLQSRIEHAAPADAYTRPRRPRPSVDKFGRDLGLSFQMTPAALEALWTSVLKHGDEPGRAETPKPTWTIWSDRLRGLADGFRR